jgi:hypothetical protein
MPSFKLIHSKEAAMTNTISKARAASAFLAVAFALTMGSAWAKDVSVKLSGAEETPPVTTMASGTGKFTIGDDKSVTGSVKTTGMEGTAAHIHLAAPGKSGPPIIPLMKGDKDTWNVPAGAKLTDDQFASFKAGDLYVNVHSEAHKDGEIRAQLKP